MQVSQYSKTYYITLLVTAIHSETQSPELSVCVWCVIGWLYCTYMQIKKSAFVETWQSKLNCTYAHFYTYQLDLVTISVWPWERHHTAVACSWEYYNCILTCRMSSKCQSQCVGGSWKRHQEVWLVWLVYWQYVSYQPVYYCTHEVGDLWKHTHVLWLCKLKTQ